MIDVDAEELVHFPEARALFPRRPCMQTLHRWRLRGCRGAKLETLLVGGLRYTSREAVSRFIRALNADDMPPAPAMTPARRQQQARAAMAALKTRGAR